jgi:sodium-dependent dicarboxylate transporter 2/3/5
MRKQQIHFLIGILLFLSFQLFRVDAFDVKAFGLAIWMVYWWVTQPIPLYATALLPIIVGLPFEMIEEATLAEAYGNNMIFLFLGGFIIALGIEKWDLHEYIAFTILRLVGQTPVRILAGFMSATAFLSMWISNTATALMMLPIALSIIKVTPRFREKKLFAIGLLLSIAFSANIGGTATLIGTPPNIQMAGILSREFNVQVDFFQWFIFAFPFMLIMLLITFFTLRFYFIKQTSFEMVEFSRRTLNKNQKRILILFGLVVSCWMSRSLINELLPTEINDTTISLTGALLLFILPSDEQKPLLVWSDLTRLPWGILFLFGGGMALASILANANIVAYFIQQLAPIAQLPMIVFVLIIATVALFATELMSNLALVSLLIPLIGEFALEMGLPLFGISAAVALSASCAFMLPVATPPNAIVYSSGQISLRNMIRFGFLLNVITVFVITGLVYLVFF